MVAFDQKHFVMSFVWNFAVSRQGLNCAQDDLELTMDSQASLTQSSSCLSFPSTGTIDVDSPHPAYNRVFFLEKPSTLVYTGCAGSLRPTENSVNGAQRGPRSPSLRVAELGFGAGLHWLPEEMPGSSLEWRGCRARKTTPLGTPKAQPRAWPDSLPEAVELN